MRTAIFIAVTLVVSGTAKAEAADSTKAAETIKAAGAGSATASAEAARKQLIGVWKGFAVEGKGERPDRGPVKLELKITESAINGIESKGQGTIDHGEGAYTLDLTQTPACLDATKTNARGRKEEYLGIYSLEGDTLKWCVTRQKQRPTQFETANRAFLLILKRQKP
jgi:uncharacterized protein (TIGR03067 family)